ncbi:MAG TPA: hypothetical protein VGF57_11565 [Roseiarcus sp.]|jgi:hypothetical protein
MSIRAVTSNMSRTRLIAAAFAGLVASSTVAVAAGPVTRQCDYRGEGKLGPLTVAYDESAHLVRVTTTDGRIWRYQDGATGRLGPTIAATDDPGPVEQFVTNKGGRVEVGFRWPDDGSTGHLAYFDPLAFKNPAKRCVWRSLWDFAKG